jgi:predicted dehydrogenase
MVRIGMLGAGVIAGIHSGSFKHLPDAKVTKIHAPLHGPRDALAAKLGAKTVDDADDILGAADVDAVMICTPTSTHAEYAVRGLENGKHVFCEKPMALSLEDADRMIAAQAQSRRVLMIGLVLRWFHEFRTLKRLVDGGTIGEVRIARTTRAAGFPRGTDDWYANYAMSGGLALDMLTHDYDFLRWCFGDVERVMARGLASAGLDHLDYCLVLLRFASGVIAHVEGSWAHPAGTFFTRAELAGTDGLIGFDSRRAVPLTVSRRRHEAGAPGVAVPESPVEESPYLQELRHFLDVVNGGTLAVTPEDGREALRIALAVNRSIATGQPVRPAELDGG